jgi:hypothetical protein
MPFSLSLRLLWSRGLGTHLLSDEEGSDYAQR